MKEKIELNESELRKIIHEVIKEITMPRIVGDEQTNKKLGYSIESIVNAKKSLGNLLSLPGQYHGLPDNIMEQIKTGVSYLDMAIQIFSNILNR